MTYTQKKKPLPPPGDTARIARRAAAFRWRWLLDTMPPWNGESQSHYKAALRALLRLRQQYPALTPAVQKVAWTPRPCAACTRKPDIHPYWWNPIQTEKVLWLCARCYRAWEGP